MATVGSRQVMGHTFTVLVLLALLSGPRSEAESGDLEPLRLSLVQRSNASTEDCGHGMAPPAAQGAGRLQGRPRRIQESEHRPVPIRTYHFNDHRRLAVVKAHVRRPDGSVIEPDLRLGVNPSLSFPTPFGDGPVHGANNVYVVEQGVEGDVLVSRNAKWITMHHSCGWGHDNKFDEKLINPQSLDTIPFEIVIDKLWDTNFHAMVTSGNDLRIKVLSYGKPVQGARITLSTEKGWMKKVVTDGRGVASVQMLRDYYPTSWPKFQRTHRGPFLVTAQYEADQKGIYKGKPYKQVSYMATLPWKYSPSEQDYASYSHGLLIGVLAMTVSGAGIYAYRERRKRPYKGIVFDE